MGLREVVDEFLITIQETKWVIHSAHLNRLREADTERALCDEVTTFLAKADQGWAIPTLHLEPMRMAVTRAKAAITPP